MLTLQVTIVQFMQGVAVPDLSLGNVFGRLVPPRVAFFTWMAAFGKILITNNLRKRAIPITDCCMCKCNAETVDHLLYIVPSLLSDRIFYFV
jgi:hypothetical protein